MLIHLPFSLFHVYFEEEMEIWLCNALPIVFRDRNPARLSLVAQSLCGNPKQMTYSHHSPLVLRPMFLSPV